MKLCFITGTRPEIIKMSPAILEAKRRKTDFIFVHTGQHYDKEMYEVFINDLNLPTPDYYLDVGSGTHAQQITKTVKRVRDVLEREKPDMVLVEGDTNSTMASALSTRRIGIRLGQVEAGCRSHDIFMPEELNRLLTDNLADLLFVPTVFQLRNLIVEGNNAEKFVIGSTAVDAALNHIELAKKKSKIDKELELGGHGVVTIHRYDNVNSKVLTNVFEALGKIKTNFYFPTHPRTRKFIEENRLMDKVSKNVKLIEPLGYFDFLKVLSKADLVLTDSGGVLEESFILNKPCLILRPLTEWVETLIAGKSALVGNDVDLIISKAKELSNMNKEEELSDALGDGKAGRRIIDKIINNKEDRSFENKYKKYANSVIEIDGKDYRGRRVSELPGKVLRISHGNDFILPKDDLIVREDWNILIFRSQ